MNAKRACPILRSTHTRFAAIRELNMPEVDPTVQFAARHLGGRTMPDDLRRLLNLQLLDAASGRANRLNDAGVIFLSSDHMPAVIESECKGRDDLSGVARLAHAQAMADMVRFSG